MAMAITVTKEDASTLYVELNLSGLEVGKRYDVMRLRLAYLGENDLNQPVYERISPDRESYWSSVAHRVGWAATKTTATIIDFECPLRPTQYYLVESERTGPFEWDYAVGPYPVSRGVLAPTIVHFNYGTTGKGKILIRSTARLKDFTTACIVDMGEIKYTARGTEQAVIGSQYPVYVADTREGRRGSIVLKVDNLGEYNTLRGIVFPAGGRIWPIIFNAGSDPSMLLDDMVVVPLDVSIEQAGYSNPNIRFVRIDYVEIDPRAPLQLRIGDNDEYITKPRANFTATDFTPASGQWVTLTDTSQGQFDTWKWTIYGNSNNPLNTFTTKGPHKVRWHNLGVKTVKLWVGGAETAAATKAIPADTKTYEFTVHK